MLVVFPLQSLTSWTSDSVSSWTGDCVTMLITNSVVFVAMHVCSPVLLTFSLKWNLYNSFVAYGNSYCPMVLLYGAKRAWPWLLMYLLINESKLHSANTKSVFHWTSPERFRCCLNFLLAIGSPVEPCMPLPKPLDSWEPCLKTLV